MKKTTLKSFQKVMQDYTYLNFVQYSKERGDKIGYGEAASDNVLIPDMQYSCMKHDFVGNCIKQNGMMFVESLDDCHAFFRIEWIGESSLYSIYAQDGFSIDDMELHMSEYTIPSFYADIFKYSMKQFFSNNLRSVFQMLEHSQAIHDFIEESIDDYISMYKVV